MCWSLWTIAILPYVRLENDICFLMPRTDLCWSLKSYIRTVDRGISSHRRQSGVQPVVITCGCRNSQAVPRNKYGFTDLVEYIMVVEVNASETAEISKIRSFVNSVILPFQVDDGVEITTFNISTVCSLNETQYQCKCEGLFVWPNDTCHSYEACDDITDGSCTCINALPIDGQLCQEPLSEFMYEYEAEIDIGFLDLFPVDYLRNLVTNTSLPLTLNNNTHITDIDMTTVCGLNGTEYECKCEEQHFWPNDTCRAYQVCD
ncbi:hypothetical protein cypCar_00034189, partial [Cyprinus carpio]